MPLVLAAMMAFAIIMVILVSVATLSVRFQDKLSRRDILNATAQAGAQDYLSRLNAYGEFNQWSAARIKSSVPTLIPQIVRDSALHQWKATQDQFGILQPSGSGQQDKVSSEFTYDLIESRPSGYLLRVTARLVGEQTSRRTLEFLIGRDLNYVPVLAVEKPYLNAMAFSRVPFFDAQSHGGRAVRKKGNGLIPHTYETYSTICNDQDKDNTQAACFRPFLNVYDQIDGDIDIAAPLTVLGANSFINRTSIPTISQFPGNGWPTISPESRVRIYGKQPHNLVASATTTVARDGTSSYQPYPVNEVRNKIPKAEFLDSSLHTIEPPATFSDIRGRANVLRNDRHKPLSGQVEWQRVVSSSLNVCRFVGPTQVVMNGNTFYIRSPHTPNNWNETVHRSPDWCKNATRGIWGVTRPATDIKSDIEKDDTARHSLAPRPGTENTWISITNVPDDAVFLIENTSPSSCNHNVVKPGREDDAERYPNTTGIGYPGEDWAFFNRVQQFSCYYGDLFIDGIAAKGRTFAAENNVYLTGAIRYADRKIGVEQIPSNANDVLGVIAQHNIIVYNNPTSRPADWRYPRANLVYPTNTVYGSTWRHWAQGDDPHNTPWFNLRRGYSAGLANPDEDALPSTLAWWPTASWDGYYIAEQGAFFYDFYPIPFTRQSLTQYEREDVGTLTLFGALYSRYSPMTHVDYFANNTRGERTLYVNGLHQRLIKDDRLGSILPPGFIGRRDSAYRVIRFAESNQHIALP